MYDENNSPFIVYEYFRSKDAATVNKEIQELLQENPQLKEQMEELGDLAVKEIILSQTLEIEARAIAADDETILCPPNGGPMSFVSGPHRKPYKRIFGALILSVNKQLVIGIIDPANPPIQFP